MENLIQTLNSTSKSTFQDDETARAQTLSAARSLVMRLQEPWERMYNTVWCEPTVILALRTTLKLKLFTHLSSKPQSSAELGHKTGCDPVLMDRMLRILATSEWIDEVDVDQWTANRFSEALRDPNGLAKGIDVHYDSKIRQVERMPEYLRVHGYQNPTSHDHAPWKWVQGIPEYPGDRWQWMESQGDMAMNFNSFLASIRMGQVPWPNLYDVGQILEGWDPKTPLLVDVAGGTGRDVSHLAQHLEQTHPEARLVLQERPDVIRQVKEAGEVHRHVELMSHDIFTPNPVEGGRAYFMRSILHDWPDKEGREILTSVKAEMKPGYSKLLIMDRVVPARAKDNDLRTAIMDVNMMCNFAALERKEAQWKSLVESAGLQYVGYQPMDGQFCMIEAVLL